MKHNLEVQDIINCIDNDEYVHIEGIDEWNVHVVGKDAYEIEVNFEDYTQVTITLFRDEYFERRLENFTQLVNNFWNNDEDD